MIVDIYGNPIVSTNDRFQRSADTRTKDRPWLPTRLDDITKLIRPVERQTLVAVSRLLVENWGPVRAIARQIPMFTVGRAWVPSLNASAGVKKSAERLVREQFCPSVDLAGNDLATVLYLLTHALIRDGEYFYLLTERKTGWPAIQIIPSHRIGQRSASEKIVANGRYKGLPIEDGVICNRRGTPVAYRFLAEDPKNDEDISARNLIHRFDCDYPEAKRGYPAIAHGLNDGRDGLQAHEWERLNMLARSSHTMIEWNETGAPDNDPRYHFDDDGIPKASGVPGEVTVTPLQGGTWKHFRAGSGSKLEALRHDTPGEVWESHNNRLIRKIYVGVPWPFSWGWEGNGPGGGTAERREIMQARQTIEDTQAIIERDARIILGYGYKKLVKLGAARDTSDWWRWSFSKPPKPTIDDGRVIKGQMDLWRAGLVSDSDMLSDLGKDPEEYWRQKFEHAADKEQAFIEIQASRGVTLDPRYKGMFTPNETAPAQESDDQQDDEEPEDQPENEEDDDSTDD